MILQQTYVDFCNWAGDAIGAAEGKLEDLSDENLAQFQGFLREEAAACHGRVELVVLLIQALIDDEIAERKAARK